MRVTKSPPKAGIVSRTTPAWVARLLHAVVAVGEVGGVRAAAKADDARHTGLRTDAPVVG